MRGDYVYKFLGQWTAGLKRLVEEGAWFRDAAYPYAATETCVGHATISTGAFPATHGMVANAWWDRQDKNMVTCTEDPHPGVKNIGYAGATAKGADTAWRMAVPSFAEELKFQTSGGTRIVTFSLKARAAITMAGHRATAATWFDGGAWVTSSAYGTQPFVEEQAKSHPAKADFGKTWSLALPAGAYWYGEKSLGAVPPAGWDLLFPHLLGGKTGAGGADDTFYGQWASSPYADTALTELAEKAVDALDLGKTSGTDFLAVSYSSVDYVGHEFGPAAAKFRTFLCAWTRTSASFSGTWIARWAEEIMSWRSAPTTAPGPFRKTCKRRAPTPASCICRRCRKESKKLSSRSAIKNRRWHRRGAV